MIMMLTASRIQALEDDHDLPIVEQNVTSMPCIILAYPGQHEA